MTTSAAVAKPEASTTKKEFSMHNGIAELMDRYDGFILDQFGVLHNGTTHLPGANEAVAALHTAGKGLVILSNSSALADATMTKLTKLGLDPSHFRNGAVTSGEEACRHVKEVYAARNNDTDSSRSKALFVTWKKPNMMEFLDACGVDLAQGVEDADFVLLHGAEVWKQNNTTAVNASTNTTNNNKEMTTDVSLDNFHDTGIIPKILQSLWEQCVARRLPLVCCNPDYTMVRPDGSRAHMPGTLADHYQSMGGIVQTFGKPHKQHFTACVERLNLSYDKVVHVGDSLHHDIQGANGAGIASIFVTGGVHKEDDVSLGTLPTAVKLEKLFAEHKQTPTHVVPLFRL